MDQKLHGKLGSDYRSLKNQTDFEIWLHHASSLEYQTYT